MKIRGSLHHRATWWEICLPFYIYSIMMFSHFFWTFIEHLRNQIKLTIVQFSCLMMYTVSLSLMNYAAIFTCYYENHRAPNDDDLPYLCWTIAIPMALFGAKVVLMNEGNQLASSRGFKKPLTLSRTKEGWEPLTHGNPSWSWILGEIKTIKPSMKSLISLSKSKVGYQSENSIRSSTTSDAGGDDDHDDEDDDTSSVTSTGMKSLYGGSTSGGSTYETNRVNFITPKKKNSRIITKNDPEIELIGAVKV
jgi:hypothetical protein